MAKDEMYNRILKEYEKCGSVKQTANNVGTTLVRAQRVLITEGLWSSGTSDKVGELFSIGKATQEIADELVVSVKTVQAYLPYSKGFYSETDKSMDALKSIDWLVSQIVEADERDDMRTEDYYYQWRKEFGI